jgi:hypothetical protein
LGNRQALTPATGLVNVPFSSREIGPPLNSWKVPSKSPSPDAVNFSRWKKMSFCLAKSMCDLMRYSCSGQLRRLTAPVICDVAPSLTRLMLSNTALPSTILKRDCMSAPNFSYD